MAKKKRKPKTKVRGKPKVMDERTIELRRELWGIKFPTLGPMKKFRTKEETLRLLKAGKLKLKGKANRQIFVEYESEATEDAIKREKYKYIKDHLQKSSVIKKQKIKKKYILLKGYDKKGNLEFWKVRIKKKSKPTLKPEIPPIYETVLGNDRCRMAGVIKCIRSLHNKRNEIDEQRPGIYDRMHDDLLLYFDEDVRNRDGKKRRITNFEFLDINPDMVREMIEPLRTPIFKRLNKFEKERIERKRSKPMSEKEKQKYARKINADTAKKKYLNKLVTYLKENLNGRRHQMIEEEQRKYKYKLEKFKRLIQTAAEAISKEFKIYSKAMLNKEIDDALNLRRKSLEEEIMTTATHKEIELDYSYGHIFLPASLTEQNESFQLDMSSYVQYWAKKAHGLQKEVDVQKEYLKKHLETTQILQTAEYIPSLKKSFAEKVKECEEEGMAQVKEALLPLKEKVEILENLRKENKEIENSVKHYVEVIPEFLAKLKDFILFTQIKSVERERLMKALEKIEEFRQELLNYVQEKFKNTVESESSSSKDVLSKTKSAISIIKKHDVHEEEMVFDMAQRILSDGDLEESAKQLLKVKFIIVDLLKRVVQDNILSQQEERTVKEIKNFSSVELVKKTEDETYITKPRKKIESFSVINKLLQVNEKLDITFQIVGDKYSIPNLVKIGEYLNRRTATVEKMLQNHYEMLENI